MRGMAIASGVAVSSGHGGKEKSGLAKVIELEVAKTIAKAYEDGLANDPEAISERMAETRARVKAEFKARESNPEG